MIGRSLLCAAVLSVPAFAGFELSLERSGAVCAPGVVFELGTVGKTATAFTFRITNTGSSGVELKPPKLTLLPQYQGAFALVDAPTTPVTLVAQGFTRFDVKLTPDSVGIYRADLVINSVTYGLQATVTNQPAFRIAVDPETLTSGQQARLTVKFDSPAVASGSGLLTMDFIGKGDPGIGFISAAPRSLPFTVTPGEDTARFQGETSIDFQTGTTAGSIIFRAVLDPDTEQERKDELTCPIATALVWVDSVRMTSGTGALTVAITGFDNTRSTTQVRFTFKDRGGRNLGSGPISADVAAAFQDYFRNPEKGGMFVLRAQFPVTGDPGQIGSVQVGMTNNIGATTANVTITE